MQPIERAFEEAAQELRAIQQTNFNGAARQLGAFLQAAAACVTPKGSPDTNVIDQGRRVNYCLDAPRLAELFVHLEACRRSRAVCHFSERQGAPGSPLSGIMLDFDIALREPPAGTMAVLDDAAAPPVPAGLDARASQMLTTLLVRHLARDLCLGAGREPGAEGAAAPGEACLQLFYIARPAAPQITAGPAAGLYKYGFHVLVPGVRVSRDYKKYLVARLREDERLMRLLAGLGAVGSPGAPTGVVECLDAGSASVPVLFAGSCKRGKQPYPLVAAYEVRADAADLADGMFAVTPVPAERLRAHNLAYELALWARPPAPAMAAALRAAGGALQAGLVRPLDYAYRGAIAAEVEATGERLAGMFLGADEERRTTADVDELRARDPEAAFLQQALGLLDARYSAEYALWRNVVFALAHSGRERGHDYLPLARWFSQRCADKWAAGGREALDALWGEIAANPAPSGGRPLTARSILFWASACQPERFREASSLSSRGVLGRYAYQHGGALGHGMIAHVVHSMLAARFVTDTVEGMGGRLAYHWYEFVLPGEPMRPGEVWKWRREGSPDAIHRLVSTEVVALVGALVEDAKEREKHARSDDEAKYYKGLVKKLGASAIKFYDNGFLNHVVEQARFLFRRRGFIESLDTDADILGVRNGVLRLARAGRPRSELVSTFHEWPVQLYTKVAYQPFDAGAPWTALLLRAIAQIVPEPDMRVWLMMFFSTGMYHGLKDPTMLLMVGAGANAKTWLARMVTKVLGQIATKLHIGLLTAEREDPNKPNSAAMRLKGRGFGYFEESEQYEVLRTARLKDIINPGEFTASEKNKVQESFDLTATTISLSNFDFIITTHDDGTWRRLAHYTAKAKFCQHPDPRNPYEHPIDRRFINEYVNDPDCQSAFLGILVHFWGRLQGEYGGNLDSVPCPTLAAETEAYRNTQDSLNRFITERVVASPEHDEQYLLPDVSGRYIEWYQANVEGSRRCVATEVIGELGSSKLAKYITTAASGARVLTGCRCLSARNAVEPLRPGESFLGSRAPGRGADSGLRPPVGDWWDWRPSTLDQADPYASAPAPAPAPAPGAPAWPAPPTWPAPAGEGRAAGAERAAEDALMSDRRARRAREEADKAAAAAALASAADGLVAELLGGPAEPGPGGSARDAPGGPARDAPGGPAQNAPGPMPSLAALDAMLAAAS